ncbi:hypothetical protein PRIPAC_92428 [Pristionchus pacificus]|uniref:Uncharacterized protein n=1 Tax=Pristionchus pacificus TaxID=54126 RepID=A0A2A6CHS9_PRIPA|nr:hypothetical protein PRIPAC_92428 [Pristionchus pacificus]|eukprot:PDM77689.1 hypothetical protein PRIPAC_34556 [Pristionchus pacificus]
MRTLFISLLLVCSLALPAHAVQKIDPRGCGTTYKCYVPKKCTADLADAAALSADIRDGLVVEVDDGVKITDDCPALIRFHAYDSHRVHVEIESFQDISTIPSIVFKQAVATTLASKSEFSCIFENNKVKGFYKHEQNPQQEKFVETITPNKLKCAFDAFRKQDTSDTSDTDLFKATAIDKIFFTIISKVGATFETKTTLDDRQNKKNNIYELRCNPATIEFRDSEDNKHIYEPVVYKLGSSLAKPAGYLFGDFSCNDKYKMEFLNTRTKKYDDVKKVECYPDRFSVKDSTDAESGLTHFDTLDIRCVTEAKFYCEYDLKTKSDLQGSKKALKRTGPDFKTKPTTLECPSEAPHLIIIDGVDERQIKNPQFECLNYGGIQQWTINGETFTEEGPEVYCTNEVQCLDTIPESAVIDGELDANFFPNCPGGTLYANKVDKGNLGAQVTATKCDKTDGVFKYTTADGKEHPFEKSSTKFICDYPVVENFAQQEKLKETIIKGSIFGIATAVGGGIIIIAVVCGFSIYKTRRDWKKQRELDMKLWNRYCLDEDEEEAYMKKKKAKNAKKGLPENEEVTAPAETCKWNKQQMSAQYRVLAQMAPNGHEWLKSDVIISKEDTLDFDPDDETNIAKATQYNIHYGTEIVSDSNTKFLKLLKELNFEKKFDAEIQIDRAENFMHRRKIPFIDAQKQEHKPQEWKE